ncbi:MAG: HEAT repeat domain-containing protein [Myxococcales bacterium]|nr:HEAT repeat domain-containing protein [Myxococcales bacterium]
MAAKAPPGYGRNDRRRTGLKLWLAVVSANIIALFAAVYVATYLRAGSGNPDLMFAFYYGAMVVAGIVDAFWLDELVFKGAFRRNLQGKTGRFVGKNDDIEDVAASMHRGASSFPILVIICCALTYGLFNLVNRGFNNWWDSVGQYAHALQNKDGDTASRVAAVRQLSNHMRPEVLEILEKHLLDEDPEVARYAAWAIGRHKENPAMTMNRLPALVERVRNGPPEVRREALLALARLQHQAIADEIDEALIAELDGPGPLDIRLLWAEGYLQHGDSLAAIDKALYYPDETVQRLAAWALSQQRDSGKGRDAADLLEQRMPAAPLATKCAIVHGLGILTDERSNLALMHAYDSLSPQERLVVCERVSVYIAPDGENDREDLMMPQETYGMKTIQAMGAMRATTPEIRSEVEPWLEAVIADGQTDPLVRESAQSLLSGIRQQRDDRAQSE